MAWYFSRTLNYRHAIATPHFTLQGTLISVALAPSLRNASSTNFTRVYGMCVLICNGFIGFVMILRRVKIFSIFRGKIGIVPIIRDPWYSRIPIIGGYRGYGQIAPIIGCAVNQIL